MKPSVSTWVSGLDIAIVLIYLVVTLFIGYLAGRGVRNIREYALGYAHRGGAAGFSSMAIIATLVATIVDGGSVVANAADTFLYGPIYIPICATIALPLFLQVV